MLLGDAQTFEDACRAARTAQPEWAARARAGPRPRDRAGRPARGGQQGGARRGSSPRRSASPTPSRSARCRRSSTPATSSSARAGACTARPCRRRCPTSSSSRSASRSASPRSSPPATSPSRCRPGTSSRRSCAATRSSGSRPSTRPRSATRSPACSTPAACPAACSTSCRPRARRRSAGSSARSTQGLVDKVGFTGSSAVGSKIGELCGRHLQSPCLELGGKNPLVVMDDADLDLAVEGALFSGFGTAGQRCTSLGVAVVHEDVHDEFVTRLDERTRAAPIGDPTRGRALRPDAARALRRALRGVARADRGPPRGARLERHRPDRRRRAARGLRRRPRGRALLPPDDRHRGHQGDDLYTTETFGPIVPVDEVQDLRRGDRARQRPRLRPLVGDLHQPTPCTPCASASA